MMLPTSGITEVIVVIHLEVPGSEWSGPVFGPTFVREATAKLGPREAVDGWFGSRFRSVSSKGAQVLVRVTTHVTGCSVLWSCL